MHSETHDRHSLVLLVSLLFFLVLSAFVRDDWRSELVLVLALYAVLVVALLKIYATEILPWPALLLTISSFLVALTCVFRPGHRMWTANWLLLSIFFGYVSLAFFSFLEKAGPINRAKLDATLGLYLILAMFYYAIFNLMQQIYPGSFMEGGRTPGQASRHSLLYFSIATLTTVGYGDVVAASRPARMIASLEAVTGVFYVAITVARLVSGYRRKDRESA